MAPRDLFVCSADAPAMTLAAGTDSSCRVGNDLAPGVLDSDDSVCRGTVQRLDANDTRLVHGTETGQRVILN